MNPPEIQEHEGFLVVRDDRIAGGTKARVAHLLFGAQAEYVYASPVYGYAQIALAHAARLHGKRATIFCAARNQMHPRTREAEAAGAQVVQVPNGYLSHVRSRAKKYCADSGARYINFGFDTPEVREALVAIARAIPVKPFEVWSVAGSGMLSRALQAAWPEARFYAVRVGAEPQAGTAKVYVARETFEKDAKTPPPFPSCSNYDAKAWRYLKAYGRPGALFWNVAA
jgi:hypothetical protein